ncbi:MAG: T9SS type A sorting domain-containing protein [Ignavibacteriaceae bacterium]
MKRVTYILLFICCAGYINAQQASDYFPSQSGYKWRFIVTPLDSLNNEIETDRFFRQDSFALTTDYEGNIANLVLSKEGLEQTIDLQPYTDSLYLYFSGANGYEYFELGGLGEFLEFVDSLISFNNFTFVDFFASLEDWYSVYRFDENVNTEYSIFSVDTTVSNDSLDLSLRFEYLGERLEDDTIMTKIGNFACKRFLIQQGVSLLFGPFPVPVAYELDTVWVAEDNWIIQDIIPATDIDLSFIGIPAFFLPGLKTEIIDQPTAIKEPSTQLNNYSLYQNYPNPFNPSTKIEFRIAESGYVSLKIYDILGNEIATLLNDEKPAGAYQVEWNAEGFSSGMYFYELVAGKMKETRKMILMK